jgi:hypothetical protein
MLGICFAAPFFDFYSFAYSYGIATWASRVEVCILLSYMWKPSE